MLLSGASHSPEGRARVINTSSMTHASVTGIDFETLKGAGKRKKLGTQKLHFQSKFVSTMRYGCGENARLRVELMVSWARKATVVFSNELHRRYGDQGIISVSLHPGHLKTEAQRHVSSIEKVLSVGVGVGCLTDGC